MNTGTPQPSDDRRDFLARIAAIGGGLVAAITPIGVGIAAFLNPLRSPAAAGKEYRLGPLSALPDDGTPWRFAIIADRTDAWNRFPDQPVGAVFVRRVPGTQEVKAFQVVCPHNGCSITYAPLEAAAADAAGNAKPGAPLGKFFCPCHEASFDLDGARTDKTSQSPRDMDSLTVEVRDGDIFVNFERFRLNTPEKVALG
ncbi:MAG: ubiquinol-cytochrome c reductase iron-sulfur subunit [Planctomycetota bacterium]